MANSGKREAHSLTALIIQDGYVPKVEVLTDWGTIRSRRPTWRERDGEWAVQDSGCPQYICINERAYPRFRFWTLAEYKAWEAARN